MGGSRLGPVEAIVRVQLDFKALSAWDLRALTLTGLGAGVAEESPFSLRRNGLWPEFPANWQVGLNVTPLLWS